MYALKQEVVNTNPNLVLYSIMFGELGDEVFTVDDLKRELAEHNADAISQGTVKNLAHFSDSLISPPSGAATPPAESRPDSASSPTRSRPRT
ncbi:hypothetical protein [Rubneribacter badeniensis]|uniref:hypothetical protein n=1 Tax=Rubneribacter badeniensis TaxID=2070688 RepID=UPI003A947FC3